MTHDVWKYSKSLEWIPEWMRTGKFILFKGLDNTGDSSHEKHLDEEAIKKQLESYIETSPNEANLIVSETEKGMHFPIIDIDFPAQLIESSTPGHYHLYLSRKMTHAQYGNLLKALCEAGIIQQGIVNQFERLGATYARLPWVRKGNMKAKNGKEGDNESQK